MKLLSIFIIVITSWMNCGYVVAQFEDYQNGPRSVEGKVIGFEDSYEGLRQHNVFSADTDNFHHKDGAKKTTYSLFDDNSNDISDSRNSLNKPTEADTSNGFPRTRLGLESNLRGSNEDNMMRRSSIISGEERNQNGGYETQKSSSTADYNIFDLKSAVKHQTQRTIPKSLKAESDQSVKNKNITILVIDENNRIRSKISVPILNTSHIIIKAHSNNIISDLMPETTTINGKYLLEESAVTATSELKPIHGNSLGKLTSTSTYSKELNNFETITVISTSFPLERNSEGLVSTSEGNFFDFKTEKYANSILLNKQNNNKETLDNKSKAAELEHSSLKTVILKIIQDHNDKLTSTTANSVGIITSSVVSSTEQQTPASLNSLTEPQVNSAILAKSTVKEDTQSSLEPAILEMIENHTEQITSSATYPLKRNTSSVINTSEHNYIDKTEIPKNLISLNKPSTEAILSNKSESGDLDLHLSLKPAILEILDENTERNSNGSSKNHFVNVYVPTFEFTQPKNSSIQANEQSEASEENRMKNRGKLVDSNTQKESITSRPDENRANDIGSIGLNQNPTTTGELEHQNETDNISQFSAVESKIRMNFEVGSTVPTTSFTTFSGQTINQSTWSPISLAEETNALINIILGQHNQSSARSFDNFISITTTEHKTGTEAVYSYN